MIDRLKAFFTNTQAMAGRADNKSGALYGDIQIATCAILLEIACADDAFTAQEEETIERLMETRFNLPRNAVLQIKGLAEKERSSSIDLWQFANKVNSSFSPAQKRELLEMIWRVIYADKALDGHEDYLVHKLATLLNCDHRELIDAKVKVLEEVRRKGSIDNSPL